MSVTNPTPSTTSAQPSLKDKNGNIILVSDQFGVGVKVISAGTTTNQRGETIKWGDSVKIVSGDMAIKLTAMQADYIRLALNQPEVVAELAKRKTDELDKLMKELRG